MAKSTGVTKRHTRSCASRDGRRCNCSGTFEAWIYDAKTKRKVRAYFATEASAKDWRADAHDGVRKGTFQEPTKITLREAAESWLAAAETGEVLSRNRKPFKPATLRGYRHDFETYVLPDLGGLRLSSITADDLQGLVDRLLAQNLSGSKVRNVIVAVQSLYRRHRRRVQTDPTEGLDLPEPSSHRQRAASPAEAAALIDALPEGDRALWATAFYGGLRRGELRGLRDEDVDLMANVIHIRRGWDDVEGEIDPKSEKGERRVPVPASLRRHLLEHRMRTQRRGADLFFGRTAHDVFTPTTIRKRAIAAWAATAVGSFLRGEAPAVELVPIGLHEARHTYVSLMHAAGVPLERIGDYVGHSSTYMTERYRHLIAGQREEDAERFDALLTGAQAGARALQAVR